LSSRRARIKLDSVMSLTRNAQTMTIPDRFNGPPRSGNGGYVSGLLARFVDGPAQVVLRQPPPLGVELQVETVAGGAVLRHFDRTVATASATSIDIPIPHPPTFRDAVEASARFRGFMHHPFPNCFVCGPDRPAGEGLRIFPGPLRGNGSVAAPWRPSTDLAGANELVLPQFVWAALDCPTGWIVSLSQPAESVFVLGTFAVDIHRRARVGERAVLAAWPQGSQGTKFFAAAALWSEHGDLQAIAQATWIQVFGKEWQ
jgi:hypothetical protein